MEIIETQRLIKAKVMAATIAKTEPSRKVEIEESILGLMDSGKQDSDIVEFLVKNINKEKFDLIEITKTIKKCRRIYEKNLKNKQRDEQKQLKQQEKEENYWDQTKVSNYLDELGLQMWTDVFSGRKIRKFEIIDNTILPLENETEFVDDDYFSLIKFIQSDHKVFGDTIVKGIDQFFALNKKHPLKDYLDGLVWDKNERCKDLFSVYCRAESKDKKQSENNEIASLNTMIGLVARVFRPGCKIDTYPVLISKGGMKKTTFCETLAGSSNLVKSMSGDLSKPDFLNQMNRAWIVEFAEMKSISSAKEEEIKSFMTRTEDTYRVAYGRTDYERKRHVFFIGTSNQDEFLFDQASARRFYPVFVQTEIDIQKLKEDRDQLLAEAVYRYKNNQPWWIYPDIEYQQQLMAQEDGEEEILETLESIETNGSGIRISTIRNSLGVRALKFTDNKISRILKKNGWQRIRHNGFNEWYRDAQ